MISGTATNLATGVPGQIKGPGRGNLLGLPDVVRVPEQDLVRGRVIQPSFRALDNEDDLGILERGSLDVWVLVFIFKRKALAARRSLHGGGVEAVGVDVG